MGNPIESMFETFKPYAPILGNMANGLKKGAGEVAKANSFGSAIVSAAGNFANSVAPWMESAKGFLNKGLMVQGTRFAYYNGTSFNFNNLEMKYTVFSDYDINGNFYSVENYIKKLAPYVMGEYYPSTNYKPVSDIKSQTVKQFLEDYVGFQEPPGGFEMDTKNLNNVLRGTLRLNIGGMWAIENLILKNMNVVLSKVQAKDPENPGNIMPLYAEITLQLAPACTIVDTGYDRITSHKGLEEIRQASTEAYKNLLEKQPNERLKQNLMAASIAYGYQLLDKQDYGQAILYFEDAIDLNDKEASAYFGLAQANEKMGCTEIALTNYEKAVSLAPGNREYNVALRDFKTANKAKLEVKEPQVNEQALGYDELIKKGDDAYKAQKYNDAIDYYTKAVVFTPQDKVTMLKIANLYKLVGNNTKALSFYNKILTLDAKNTDAYFNKGLILASQKNYDECIQCFEKVIELSPDYPYAYYSLGLAYEQKEDIDKALEYYYLYSGIEKDEKMLNVVNQKIKQLEK